MLDKKAFFKHNDAVIEKVDVPEWGKFNEEIHVRNMSGAARSIFEMDLVNTKEDSKDKNAHIHNIRARLTLLCCCDKDGNLHFDESDLEQVNKRSAAALEPIFEAALKLNKLSSKDVDEMEKTLGANQS